MLNDKIKVIKWLLLLCFFGCERYNDSLFVEKRTGLDLEECGNQVSREESDIYLKLEYQVQNAEKFIDRNNLYEIDCKSNYFLKRCDKCLGINKANWSVILNSDSSICYIEIWFSDFSGD